MLFTRCDCAIARIQELEDEGRAFEYSAPHSVQKNTALLFLLDIAHACPKHAPNDPRCSAMAAKRRRSSMRVVVINVLLM